MAVLVAAAAGADEESHDVLAALPAPGVLPARSGEGQVVGQRHGGENLLLLGPQVLGLNGDVACMQHPIHRDRILVTVRPQLPYPNNNTELHIVV